MRYQQTIQQNIDRHALLFRAAYTEKRGILLERETKMTRLEKMFKTTTTEYWANMIIRCQPYCACEYCIYSNGFCRVCNDDKFPFTKDNKNWDLNQFCKDGVIKWLDKEVNENDKGENNEQITR